MARDQKGNKLTTGIVSATDLEIIVDKGEEETRVRLRGRLGIDSSPDFRDHLLALLQEQSAKAVVLDVTDLSYIDVSGLATLVEGLKVARNRQSILCLKGLQGRVLRLFEVTGLLHLFETNGCRSASTASKVS